MPADPTAAAALRGYSQVVSDIAEAMSIRFNNIVYDLKRKGTRVTVLSLGEAFFDIPLLPFDPLPFPDLYHYTHSRGIYDLRVKIARYYTDDYSVPVNADTEIIVTAGSKAAIHFSLMSVLNPGDEVIIHEPAWVSYPEQIKLCYGKPVMMPYDMGIRDYERFVTSRTKVIIISNPNNPRGQVFTESEIRYLLDLARANGLYVLADEAYSEFVSGNAFHSLGSLDPEKSNSIVCNSISKNFGISGWRLGYVISNPDLIGRVLKVNQHIITCPASVLQYYVAHYFEEILRITRPQIAAIVEKRRAVARIMDEIGLQYLSGEGAFYFFVSLSPSRLGSEEFAMRLLVDDHVSVVPGVGYGESCDKFVRVSIGTETLESIRMALHKVKALADATA